jgi:V/A-type H+-transporting ATPase subunit I
LRARLESIEALKPEELKNCFAVGVVQNEIIPRMAEYLKRYPDTFYRATKISEKESLLFVFGSEDSRKWVESLFLVFEIRDIFDVLDPKDVLLVLDPSRRQQAIEKYKTQLTELDKKKVEPEDETPEEKKIREKLTGLENSHQQKIIGLREEYDAKIKDNERKQRDEVTKLQSEQGESLGEISFFVHILNIFSRTASPVLRSKVISVIQGYTPESMIPELRNAVAQVEKQVGETLFVEVTEIGHDDHHAPTPALEMPGFLGPSWILTRLRGWPSAGEINPGYISVLVFCFQFGLMFGDMGQGLIYLLIGIALHKRFDKGMMRYLTNLFIPMGIAAIIFGFMYDSAFLIEHGISNWLHSAHIELPFHYPIMPNPVHEVGELMNLIFLVGAVEIVLGALLGALNAFKEKNYVGMIGEHGFGMGLYVTGLYLSAASLFTEGLDIMLMVANWPFKLMLAGMALSFMEPVLHSVTHGHGVSIESLGEGLGGLLMTFVEGLANMFSFLRIAAFALAHASLAGAGEALGHAIGSGILGLLIMNIIALSFEFISSSVQSLRLLYYEFMGKFFHGAGVPFKPFRVREV